MGQLTYNTQQVQQRLDAAAKIVTNGDGSKFLADNGQYKEMGGGESIDNISLIPLFDACIKSEGSAVTDEDIETMYRYAEKYGTETPIYGADAYSFSFGALSDATMLEFIEKGMETTALSYGIFVISKRDSPERQAILGGSIYPQSLLGGIPGFYRAAYLVYDLTVAIDLDKKKVESQKLDGLTISSDDKDLIINQAMSMNGTSFSISLSKGGDGTKALMDNGSYKSIAETLFSGVANVSNLSGLPTDKYTIAVKASAASTLSFKSTPKEGMVYNIDILNTGSSDFDQPIPTGANWQSDDSKVSCKAGKVTSVSVRYIHGKYVVRV